MRKRNWGCLALAVALAACGRKEGNVQLAALDDALKSGVLTKAEYDAKRTALIQASALEDAYQSGVLSKAEYDAKKAALFGAPASVPMPASTPAPVPAPIANPAPGRPQPYAAAPVSAPVSSPAPAHPANPLATTAAPPPSAPAPAAPAQPAGAAGRNYLVLRKAPIMDRHGYEREMPSAFMLVPADWQFQGETSWDAKNLCQPTPTVVRASGSDGRGFELFPIYNWTWSDDLRTLQISRQSSAAGGQRPCDIAPLMKAADFIRYMVPRIRPNAQLVGIDPMPEIAKSLQQQDRETMRMAAQYGLTKRVQSDAARGHVRYNLNGQAVEEWILVEITLAGSPTPTLGPPGFYYFNTALMVAMRAPQGQLDANQKLFNVMVNSYTVNPEWQARTNQVNSNIFNSTQAEIRKRTDYYAKTQNEIADIRRQGAEYKQRSEDHVFGQYSQATRGVETYRNPVSGETWDLSNQYSHAWVNNRNEIVLSDQEGWDPNVALNGGWTALQHVKQ